jgi:hypothetical protein
MAENEGKKSYPKIPAKNWWDLRRRFQQSMPTRVTGDYLQSVLGLASAGSATNLIGPLRSLGLVDDDGKPTDLANRWRHDEDYADVCGEIIEATYPAALREAHPPPALDMAGVKSWFMRNTGSGESAARAMTAMYQLIARADPARAEGAAQRTVGAAKKVNAPARATKQAAARSPRAAELAPSTSGLPDPTVHIDVQVHISPEASADQIDQVFESMARHLYGRSQR